MGGPGVRRVVAATSVALAVAACTSSEPSSGPAASEPDTGEPEGSVPVERAATPPSGQNSAPLRGGLLTRRWGWG